MSISVIIPVYKNKELFLKNLSHNIPLLIDCEIIVVNDYPSESLINDLKIYPHLTLLENKINLGFGPTVNRGVAASKNEYIFLLNSDVVLTDTSYQKALTHFSQDKKVFGVSFAQVEKDGSTVGKNRFVWTKGLFQHSRAKDLETGINGWAEGGSTIIDRQKFNELHGFDSLYSPFYWEDIDLSYRAWKKGYTVLFDSSIVVGHHHESTIGSYFSRQQVTITAYRNQFIFIWKNISSTKLLFNHLLHLPIYMLKGDPLLKKGIWKAFLLLGIIMKTRFRTKNSVTDEVILKMFS